MKFLTLFLKTSLKLTLVVGRVGSAYDTARLSGGREVHINWPHIEVLHFHLTLILFKKSLKYFFFYWVHHCTKQHLKRFMCTYCTYALYVQGWSCWSEERTQIIPSVRIIRFHRLQRRTPVTSLFDSDFFSNCVWCYSTALQDSTCALYSAVVVMSGAVLFHLDVCTPLYHLLYSTSLVLRRISYIIFFILTSYHRSVCWCMERTIYLVSTLHRSCFPSHPRPSLCSSFHCVYSPITAIRSTRVCTG